MSRSNKELQNALNNNKPTDTGSFYPMYPEKDQAASYTPRKKAKSKGRG